MGAMAHFVLIPYTQALYGIACTKAEQPRLKVSMTFNKLLAKAIGVYYHSRQNTRFKPSHERDGRKGRVLPHTLPDIVIRKSQNNFKLEPNGN